MLTYGKVGQGSFIQQYKVEFIEVRMYIKECISTLYVGLGAYVTRREGPHRKTIHYVCKCLCRSHACQTICQETVDDQAFI